MPGRRKEIAAELVTEGRRLYENTLTPVRDIARVMGISRNTLDNRIAEWKWLRRYYVGDGVIAANEPQHAPATLKAGRLCRRWKQVQRCQCRPSCPPILRCVCSGLSTAISMSSIAPSRC